LLAASLFGSFINLAADRLPKGESVVRPRSHCRSCGRILDLIDLIPVGGYLIRRGRCASCGVAIGVSSPVVEALCAALMLASLVVFGLGRGALVGSAAVALVGSLAVCLALIRARGLKRESLAGARRAGGRAVR
jgi:prepilin signal peptidase PulO-like enzyme (type II secretory pathway)